MLTKLKIYGYANSDYSGDLKIFTAQVNPSTIQSERSIRYHKVEVPGITNPEVRYMGHVEGKLSFKILLDDTGIIRNKILYNPTLQERMQDLLEAVYDYYGESHEPRYAIIYWGDIVFHGRLQSFSEEYTLFSPEGRVLRVTISLSFTSHLNKEDSDKKAGALSPDLSRSITLKAGESIAWWCWKIYKDASYCADVAAYNGLNRFTGIQPGTVVQFPPLLKNGKITR